MWRCLRAWAVVCLARAGTAAVVCVAGCTFDPSGLAPGGAVDAALGSPDARVVTGPDAAPDARVEPRPDAGPDASPDAAPLDANEDTGLERGLVAYWPLDEITGGVTPDLGQHGLDGTVQGATLTEGQTSGALRFDGVNDAVLIGNPAQLNFGGAITIAAWIRPRAFFGDFRNIVAHGYTLGPDAEVFLRIHDADYEGGSFDGENHLTEDDRQGDDNNRWIHLAIVHDGAAWRLYRDGQEEAVTMDATGAVPVNEGWAIGARGNGGERFFEGDIDEVRIYDRALSADEVAALAAL